MTEFDDVFSSLSPQELGLLLENQEAEIEKADEEKIRTLAFQKAGLDSTNKSEKSSAKKRTQKSANKRRAVFFRAVAAAACLCVVSAAAFFGVKTFSKPQTESTGVSIATSSSTAGEKALMLAISSGDEGLIEKLLKSGVLVSRDILGYAVECTSFLSYRVIGELAQAVEEVFGSTGLDPLLESTLIGNSERALQELKKREGILMTPSEKLAFFFSVAFCNSDVVEAFTEKGADINATDAAGNNILQIAEKCGNKETAEYARVHGISE